MRGKACIDASIVLKWVIEEADSASARDLLEEFASAGTILLAPMLLAHEVASVLRQKCRRGYLDAEEAEEAFAAFTSFPITLLDDSQLRRDAWDIARELDLQTTYDAAYLALARREDCRFWTADEKLFKASSSVFSSIRLLDHPQA